MSSETKPNLSQVKRFRAFTLRILVCSDLLARGVDFGRVSLVVHLQPPRSLATYLHRVGRTGRYGTLGASVLLLSPGESCFLLPRLNSTIEFNSKRITNQFNSNSGESRSLLPRLKAHRLAVILSPSKATQIVFVPLSENVRTAARATVAHSCLRHLLPILPPSLSIMRNAECRMPSACGCAVS